MFNYALRTLGQAILPRLIGWSHPRRGHSRGHRAGWRWSQRAPGQGRCWVAGSQLHFPWVLPTCCCHLRAQGAAGLWQQCLRWNKIRDREHRHWEDRKEKIMDEICPTTVCAERWWNTETLETGYKHWMVLLLWVWTRVLGFNRVKMIWINKS